MWEASPTPIWNREIYDGRRIGDGVASHKLTVLALVRCGAWAYDDDLGLQTTRPGADGVGPFLLILTPDPLPIGCSPHVSSLLAEIWLLAQGEAQPAPDPNGFLRFMGPMVIIMVLFYFMLIRPQKRKEQELREMVRNVKENDRVVTIGGIYGVVTNVQRDADRVTIRVDEATGAKLKINMSAIARVLTADEQESGAPSK
jgi:preprotein translocase subunit YajC